MAVAPIEQERVAGAAWAWSRRRMERMARSNSGGDALRVLVAGPRPVVEALSLSARKGTTITASVAHRCQEHSCRLKRPHAEGV
jgi:hypothetical protein